MALTIQPKVMATAGRAQTMAITGRRRRIHLVSQNKHISFWHQQLAHVSNACVVRASRLVDGVVFKQEGREYDPTEILIDSDNSDATLN